MFRVSNSQLSFSCENAFCTTSFFLNKRFITRWDLTQRITRKEKESCYSQIRERSTIADDGISVGDGISVQGVCEILYPFLARIVFTFFNKIYTLILYSLIYSPKRTKRNRVIGKRAALLLVLVPLFSLHVLSPNINGPVYMEDLHKNLQVQRGLRQIFTK